jgi:hypothetical protein
VPPLRHGLDEPAVGEAAEVPADRVRVQGRIDRAELRRAMPRPPKLPWWTKIFLGRKTRELLREAEQEDPDFPA